MSRNYYLGDDKSLGDGDKILGDDIKERVTTTRTYSTLIALIVRRFLIG